MKTKMEIASIKTTETIGKMEVEKKGGKNGELAPSFWRTIRSLKNVHRLDLLKCVYDAEETLGVVKLASETGLTEPLTSNYLRMLNARGLISVKRDATHVYYGTAPDRSLPTAISLQEGFRRFFATEPTKGWQKRLIQLLDGFSHYNRINIIRFLAVTSNPSRAQLIKAAGVCEKTFGHHFTKLRAANLVESVRVGAHVVGYRIPKQSNPIAKLLLKEATLDLGLINRVWE